MKWLKIAVWFLAMYIPFILLSLKLKNRNNRRFSFRQSKIFSLIIVSIFEKIGSLLLIFVIARLLSIHIQLIQLFPIYSIATCAGFLSMLPGGIGSFDFILLMGFHYHHISSETALLVLLLFRICYYFIPFIIGCGLFGTRILNQFIHYLVKGKNQKTEPQSVNS
jgi:phosphatidylglycerol lysyltransferase